MVFQRSPIGLTSYPPTTPHPRLQAPDGGATHRSHRTHRSHLPSTHYAPPPILPLRLQAPGGFPSGLFADDAALPQSVYRSITVVPTGMASK